MEPDGRIATVWHERYHCPEAGGLPSTVKQKAILDRASDHLRLYPDIGFDSEHTWREIQKVHSQEYVEAFRRGTPSDLAQSQGFRWCPELAESVSRIWSGHIHACRLALEAGLVFHPVSGAHHARHGKGGGFCTFNYLVGAATVLLDEGLDRVMVLDLDTHQGNGTWELASESQNVSIFDLSGVEFDVPEIESERRFARIARDVDGYFDLLAKLPQAIDDFRPQLIQYQAGMDCHEGDMLGGIRGMTAARLLERDAFVFKVALERSVPVVFNLAGGYQGGVTTELHLGTIRMAHASQEAATRPRWNSAADETVKRLEAKY